MGKFDGLVLVADFDGTFRPYGMDCVPEENLRAVEGFMTRGGRFTVATGRDPRSFRGIRGQFAVNAPAILSNGAVLQDAGTGESLYESFLPFSCREDFRRLLAAFPEVGMEVHRGEDVRVCRLTPGVEEHLRNMGAPVSVVPPEKILFPWTKAAFIVPGPLAEENPQCGDILAWLEENCPGRYDAAPSGAIVDVACAGSTKGTGVLRLLEYLGAGREGLFCAGDGWNDLPMLRLAHRAFAPETALAAVRQEPGITVTGSRRRCLRDIVELLEELY